MAPATFASLAWNNLDTLQLVMKLTPLNMVSDIVISQVRKGGQRTTFQQKVRE